MPEISQSLKDRLSADGPKRILALDGGGIRGAISLGYLEQIEKILAERHEAYGIKREDFRLSDYFDLIGGTSTGAIIASLLAATRFTVTEIKQLYLELGKKIFSDKRGLNFYGKQIFTKSKYDSAPLAEELERIFGDARLGDLTNLTGLCVVTKRLDTCSTWPVTNNPAAKYFDQNRFFIKHIIRASTAAPSFFQPEIIDVGSQENGVFVDGGLSMANNPSLQLFLVATLKGFRLRWETGEDKLLIVSIGTGRRNKKLVGEKWKDPNLLDIGRFAPEQLMTDANELVETMMHYIGKGTGVLRHIDSEIEDLSEDAIHGGKAFCYVRYNIELGKNELDQIGVTGLSDQQLASLIAMDEPGNINLLTQVGEKAGADQVKKEHLPVSFDRH